MDNDLLSNDCPEEVFVEGVKGLYCYNGIIKFNFISRPIHDPAQIDGAKIVKTITTTVQNFENMVNFLQSELNQIKSNFPGAFSDSENVNNDNLNKISDFDMPPKGRKI